MSKKKENTQLFYAFMEIGMERKILISAKEVFLFDRYLEFAKKQDKGVYIDIHAAEQEPLKIVYGGMILQDSVSFEEAKKLAEEGKNCVLIELLENEESIAASSYEDIIFYPEIATMDFVIPFAALMSTCHEEDNLCTSITLFHSQGRVVWEDMVNRKFVLACRKFEKPSINLNIDNWKEQIDLSKLKKAYYEASFYTGTVDEN